MCRVGENFVSVGVVRQCRRFVLFGHSCIFLALVSTTVLLEQAEVGGGIEFASPHFSEHSSFG